MTEPGVSPCCVDNKIGFVKNFIRKRLTEEGEDQGWDAYFDEAVDAIAYIVDMEKMRRRSYEAL